MSIVTNLGYIIGGVVIGVLFIIGLLALLGKNRIYGKSSIIMPLVAYTLATATSAAVLIYLLYNLSYNVNVIGKSFSGIEVFVGVTAVMLLIGGLLMSKILEGQGTINVQSFNFFASFLIFQFCLMTAIVTVINKIRSFD
jgi:hypothetical protein